MDLRLANGERTRVAATVSWVQVDNMLPFSTANSGSSGGVVLAPTAVKTPQPTLQLSVLASPKETDAERLLLHNLDSVVMLLQELDLNLEERYESTRGGRGPKED